MIKVARFSYSEIHVGVEFVWDIESSGESTQSRRNQEYSHPQPTGKAVHYPLTDRERDRAQRVIGEVKHGD